MRIKTHVLSRLDLREIPSKTEEIRLICKIKNETLRLPYFLRYYREAGVDRFIFIDNGSSDGTVEYLLGQRDCHMFQTRNSFPDSGGGIDWQNAILDLHGAGHWCVIVDTDELLVFPHREKVGLREFCGFLDREGSEGLYTFMLDMYHDSSISEATCQPGKPFTEICSLFDTDYTFVRRINYRRRVVPPFPEIEVIGGPRSRKFSPEHLGTSVFARMKSRLLWEMSKPLYKYGLLKNVRATPQLLLFKIPLVKWKRGYALESSTHVMTRLKLSDVTGVLLHFKFFSDFYDKISDAIKTGQYTDGSIHYKRFRAVVGDDKNFSFKYRGTAQYRNSDDVLRYNLMKTSASYDEFVAKKGTRRMAG
jgi:glycosyltransferase involved in cell wall biosynthesis